MSQPAEASQLVPRRRAPSLLRVLTFPTSTRDTNPTPDAVQEIRDTLAAVESRASLDRCLHAPGLFKGLASEAQVAQHGHRAVSESESVNLHQVALAAGDASDGNDGQHWLA